LPESSTRSSPKWRSLADTVRRYGPAKSLVPKLIVAALLTPLLGVNVTMLSSWLGLVLILLITGWVYDVRHLPDPASVQATRVVERLEEGRATTITLSIRVPAVRSGWLPGSRTNGYQLRTRDDLPPELTAADDGPTPLHTGQDGKLAPPATLSVVEIVQHYTATPRRRGMVSFGDIHVRLTGPLGFVQGQYRVPAEASTLVWPDTRMTAHKQAALQEALQQDGRIVRHVSHGMSEFAQIRDFSTGDDPRHINWFASARSARLLKNVYEPERGQHIILALDCGRAMGVEQHAGKTRLDLAIEAAILTGTAALSGGDDVTLIAFADVLLRHVPGLRGTAGLRTLTETLCTLQAAPVYTGMHLLAERLFRYHKRRSLLILFTDLADLARQDLFERQLSLLQRQHACVVGSFTDKALEAAARSPAESWPAWRTTAAAAALLEDRHHARERLRRRGTVTLEAPDELFSASLREYTRFKQSRGVYSP